MSTPLVLNYHDGPVTPELCASLEFGDLNQQSCVLARFLFSQLPCQVVDRLIDECWRAAGCPGRSETFQRYFYTALSAMAEKAK